MHCIFVYPVIKQVEHNFGRRVHRLSNSWTRDGKLCNSGFEIHSLLMLINGVQRSLEDKTSPETSLNAQQGADSRTS